MTIKKLAFCKQRTPLMTLLLRQEVYMFLVISSAYSLASEDTCSLISLINADIAMLIAVLMNAWLNHMDLGFGRACFAYVIPWIQVVECSHDNFVWSFEHIQLVPGFYIYGGAYDFIFHCSPGGGWLPYRDRTSCWVCENSPSRIANVVAWDSRNRRLQERPQSKTSKILTIPFA